MIFKNNTESQETEKVKNKKNIFKETDENGELPENSARRYFSVLGFAILVSFIIKDLLYYAVVELISRLAPELLSNYFVAFLISSIPLYGVAFPLCALFLRKLPRATPLKNDIKAHHWLGGMCIAFTFMIAGNYISQIIVSIFSVIRGEALTNPLTDFTQSTPPVFVMLAAVIIAPIAEELFFRKLLCDKLLPLGEGYAIFVSSAIFALAHGNFFQIFYAFTLGCFFAYVYINTGKLKHTIIYHTIINLLGTIVSTWILSRLDLEAMMSGEISIRMIVDNLIPILALLAYEFVVLGSAFVGMILLFLNLKKIRIRGGLISPAKDSRISCVFMNFGIASLILYFALTLVMSLFV